jgi:HAD superfamily hydrolase (TIGR01509 family)
MLDTVLFDWDGTLVDSAEQAFEATRKAFGDLGIVLDLQAYNRVYSPNWYVMYAQLGLPRLKWQEADELFLRHYDGSGLRMQPGGWAALDELARRNYALGIVTSGSGSRVRQEIVSFGLGGVFKAVICGEDVVNRKPDPEGLGRAMERMRKRPGSCCYVGDCPEDVEMGRRANMLTIGIPGPYPASRRLKDARPDYLFDSLSEFVANCVCARPA